MEWILSTSSKKKLKWMVQVNSFCCYLYSRVKKMLLIVFTAVALIFLPSSDAHGGSENQPATSEEMSASINNETPYLGELEFNTNNSPVQNCSSSSKLSIFQPAAALNSTRNNLLKAVHSGSFHVSEHSYLFFIYPSHNFW